MRVRPCDRRVGSLCLMHIPVGGRGQARKKRHAATSTISASKGEGESASADEIEKCLEDEECKSETLLTLEKTLASVDEDGNVDGGVVVEAKREKKGFESTKTADEGDYEGIVVSEPPLNIERLKSVQRRFGHDDSCLLYTSPSPRDMRRSRMPSSA